jgi:LmbE family N-acetylglucosaminyl deacetylase
MTSEPIGESRLLEPARHVFLSPHYDDIALSCGGTAARIAESGAIPDVALMFGDHPDPRQPLTDFAQTLHRQWGLDAAEVIASRRAEEAIASAVLGTKASFLPFRDAIYRGARYQGDDQLFGAPADDEASLPSAIIDELELGSESVRVYAPLAIGFHVDHQLAFLTGVELAKRGFEAWFYEDLPYALKPGARARRVEAIGSKFSPDVQVDISAQWEKKIDAIFAYPSQLSTIFVEYVDVGTRREQVSAAMAEYARQVGNGTPCERFWTIEQ